jgi:uncharacterized membrane protein
MQMLIAAAAVFLAIHLFVAGTRLRDVITRGIGERAYLALFSLASLGVIVWLAMAYNVARASGDNRALFNLGRGVHDMGILIVALAFLVGVQGMMAPNPTSVQQESAAAKEGTIKGVLRITRHPFLWSVVLWSGFHLAANGNLASVIFFGSFFVLALFGTFSIDAKRRRKLGAAWDAFAAKTSNIPFGAVVTGRNTLNIRESFGWRFWVALITFIAVLFAHVHIFGVSPLPGGVTPV